MISITINTEFILLQNLLKFSNFCSSGGEAKQWIQQGEVLVNGEICTLRGKKLRPGDVVSFGGKTLTICYAN